MARAGPTVESFLAAERDAILDDWERRAGGMPAARRISHEALRDHLPQLLDEVCRQMETAQVECAPDGSVAHVHAVERLEIGFDLAQVVREYALLRDVVHERWERIGGAAPGAVDAVRRFDVAIDHAIEAAVVQYVATRDRVSLAMERVSAAALSSAGAADFLERLLEVLVDTLPAADTGSALLEHDGRLRVCATIGLEGELQEGFTLAVGEGLAGSIAAGGRVEVLTEASKDPRVRSEVLRARGVQAMVGVPLRSHDRLLGVALVGSRTAPAFSGQDVTLVVAMAERAATGILLHDLREQAEERARALHEALERQRELQALVESHVDLMFVYGRDLRLRYANPAMLRLWGRSAADAVGRTVAELGYAPPGVERWQTELRRALGGETVRGEAEAHGRVVEYVAVPVRSDDGRIDAVAGIGRDITARDRERVRERLLRDVAQTLVVTLDLDAGLQSAADALVPDLADWVLVELVEAGTLRVAALAHPDAAERQEALRLRAHMPPELQPRVAAWEQVVAEGQELVPEITDELLVESAQDPEQLAFLRAAGLRSMILLPLTARGRTFGALTLLTSTSGRTYDAGDLACAREVAHRIGLAADNARLLREAHEAADLRERVLAVVSHDLRNPLGAIRLAADLLMRRGVGEPHRKQVETILRASSRAEALLRDLLDAASIRAGRLAIAAQPEPVAPLLREAVDEHVPLAREKGIALVGDVDVGDVSARCDRARVLQVLGNLVGNALKFCRPGDTVTVRGRVAGRFVRVEVADTGPGIAAEDLAHVFDPYWSGGHEAGGTGLGLAIVRGIVEAHGGTCGVDSEVGRGTTFAFTLPVAEG